jgi:hypothetical protein
MGKSLVGIRRSPTGMGRSPERAGKSPSGMGKRAILIDKSFYHKKLHLLEAVG